MKKKHLFPLTVCAGALLVSGLCAAEPAVPAKTETCPDIPRASADSMLEIIRNYRASVPDSQRELHPLRVVYFTGSDSEAHPGYATRVAAWMTDFADFFKTEMARNGFPGSELQLERKADGSLDIHRYTGKKKASEYGYKYTIGYEMVAELEQNLTAYAFDQNVSLVITNFSARTPDGTVKLWSPFYGIGWCNQRRGCAFCVDEPGLTIDALKSAPKGKVKVDEHTARNHNTQSYARTYLGGAIHELGHGLSLPHDKECGEEAKKGTSLMGSGNYTYRQPGPKEAFLTFCDAVRLVSHPAFNPDGVNLSAKPGFKYTSCDVTPNADSTLSFEAKVEAAVPPYAVVFYLDAAEPKGDYDACTHVANVTAQKTVKTRINIKPFAGKRWELRVIWCLANGATASGSYYFDHDGSMHTKPLPAKK